MLAGSWVRQARTLGQGVAISKGLIPEPIAASERGWVGGTRLEMAVAERYAAGFAAYCAARTHRVSEVAAAL